MMYVAERMPPVWVIGRLDPDELKRWEASGVRERIHASIREALVAMRFLPIDEVK